MPKNKNVNTLASSQINANPILKKSFSTIKTTFARIAVDNQLGTIKALIQMMIARSIIAIEEEKQMFFCAI